MNYKLLGKTGFKISEVSCVIPGASSFEQVKSNLQVEDMENLSLEDMKTITSIYSEFIKPKVHQLW
ncbi:hypothetical protein V8G69_13785 [Gaetbulibacter sp. M235]|uniref:hypothetical protein n=1 Tax=Gaetbulibacter sp. M235 TaxID=3126510 RepID=UPI00374F73C0